MIAVCMGEKHSLGGSDEEEKLCASLFSCGVWDGVVVGFL